MCCTHKVSPGRDIVCSMPSGLVTTLTMPTNGQVLLTCLQPLALHEADSVLASPSRLMQTDTMNHWQTLAILSHASQLPISLSLGCIVPCTVQTSGLPVSAWKVESWLEELRMAAASDAAWLARGCSLCVVPGSAACCCTSSETWATPARSASNAGRIAKAALCSPAAVV